MSEIRILTGSPIHLKALLGKELAAKLNIQSGDTIVQMETEEQISVGRDIFEALIQKGWLGYEVEQGKTKQQVKEFNPELEKVLMFGPIGGG